MPFACAKTTFAYPKTSFSLPKQAGSINGYPLENADLYL
jgi:hypothetical protein